MEPIKYPYLNEYLDRGQNSGYAAAHKAIAKIQLYPQRYADIIKNELKELLDNCILQMRRCEINYKLHHWAEDYYENYGYWFACRTEVEEYLNECERYESLLTGIKPDKKDERHVSLAVYFKNSHAADYMRHRQALEVFLKRAKRDKKHRIMSVWHYLKQTGAITDASESPYKFCLALHAELYNGVADGSAYQGRYYEELSKEYEEIWSGG